MGKQSTKTNLAELQMVLLSSEMRLYLDDALRYFLLETETAPTTDLQQEREFVAQIRARLRDYRTAKTLIEGLAEIAAEAAALDAPPRRTPRRRSKGIRKGRDA